MTAPHTTLAIASLIALGLFFSGCARSDEGSSTLADVDAGLSDADNLVDTSKPDDAQIFAVPPGRPDVWTPPPISGGTLAVTRDGATAIVSDPDSDRVLLVDLARAVVRATLELHPGDEPGRIVEGDDRRAYVVLRGGGALLTIDLDAGAVRARRGVCPMPRGVAWDEATSRLHVVCAGGELVTLRAEGDVVRRVALERDLRDVVVQGDRLLVTRFRAAETLVLDEEGQVTRRIPAVQRALSDDVGVVEGAVAWRATASPGGGLWLLHQRVTSAPVSLERNGSYSQTSVCRGARGLSRPGLTRVRPPFDDAAMRDLPEAALAVDVAASPDGERLAVAIPGNLGAAGAQLVEVLTRVTTTCPQTLEGAQPERGQVVAVAYAPSGRLVAQTRAPAGIFLQDVGVTVALGGREGTHGGHRLFHTNPSGGMTCASCHPEGDDDGRTWTFAPIGPRRTQPLRGGLLGTEPFHWDGDLRDFRALVEEVMVRRMGGVRPGADELSALATWLDALPPRPGVASDKVRVRRGAALFRDPVAGCAGCHNDRRYGGAATVDVGTGGRFQVPSLLGLAWRAPYLHDGRAPTLRDRFVMGGGDLHGRTSQLTPAQVDDLVAFLESL